MNKSFPLSSFYSVDFLPEASRNLLAETLRSRLYSFLTSLTKRSQLLRIKSMQINLISNHSALTSGHG